MRILGPFLIRITYESKDWHFLNVSTVVEVVVVVVAVVGMCTLSSNQIGAQTLAVSLYTCFVFGLLNV